MGGVTPDAAHVLDLSHVDSDGQLSGIENAKEGDHDWNKFHILIFIY